MTLAVGGCRLGIQFMPTMNHSEIGRPRYTRLHFSKFISDTSRPVRRLSLCVVLWFKTDGFSQPKDTFCPRESVAGVGKWADREFLISLIHKNVENSN